MKHKSPFVSVVMPVYNREKYVRDAVKSILKQTLTDFEFIIIDDGSTDSTPEILKSYKDRRIKLILNTTNKGNYAARNEGMQIARGKYICVMDSDDIALSNRIQTQFDFMESNKQFGLCGSYVRIIGSDEIITAPEDYHEIKVWSMSNIMFRHPTIFIRSEFLKKYNLKYNDSYLYAGDYDFLVRAAHLFPVTNIQEVLLEYRRHPDQISSAHKKGQFEIVNKVILSQLKLFKQGPTNKEKQLHLALMNRFQIQNKGEFEQLQNWANYLLERNNQIRLYNPEQLANFLKSLLKYINKQYEILKKGRSSFNAEIQLINDKLNPYLPLLFQKEWTILPDFTANLINIIAETKPSVVVVCGSGLSTLIFGYLLKNGWVSKCISIEHDMQFYESTKSDLIKHQMENFVNLIYAPLKPFMINEKEWFWYDTEIIEKEINRIDLLLVDGPPGQIQKHSRYPAVPLLKKFFHKNSAIVIDDMARQDEQEIIKRWEQENPEFKSTYINTVKGMCVIKQNNKP